MRQDKGFYLKQLKKSNLLLYVSHGIYKININFTGYPTDTGFAYKRYKFPQNSLDFIKNVEKIQQNIRFWRLAVTVDNIT
jgi:hypothetical protein